MQAYIFINANSGAIQSAGADRLSSRLTENLQQAGISAGVTCAGAAEFKTFARQALKSPAPAMAVIAGGDGTFAMAAEAFSNSGVPVAFLPGGTMNLVTHDLGVGGDLEKAVDDLPAWRPKNIDVGWVNGRAFLNNIVFGDYAGIAEARELLRNAPTLDERLGAVAEAAHTLFHSQPVRFRLAAGGEMTDMRSNMLMIANNRYTGAEGMRPTRDRLDRGLLALYLSESRDGADLVARVLEVLGGDIASSETMELREAARCFVSTEESAVTVAVDGEPIELQSPVEIRIEPGALSVLCPADA